MVASSGEGLSRLRGAGLLAVAADVPLIGGLRYRRGDLASLPSLRFRRRDTLSAMDITVAIVASSANRKP